MNSDDIASPVSPTALTSTGRRIRVRSLKKSLAGQEASLPSIPSDDNDWVSPFTLPPLPALRKNRSQLDRSPEDRHHDRSGSSAYYAAAWGSPYATPSPNQSPAIRLGSNKSSDLQSSPLVSREFVNTSAATEHTRPVSEDPLELTTDPSSSPTLVQKKTRSQRRNWLSESEDSGSEADQALRKTPTRRKRIHIRSFSSGTRSHNVKESVDTITPETFNGTSSIAVKPPSSNPADAMAEIQNTLSSPGLDEMALKEKPLPSLPTTHPAIMPASQLQSQPQLPTQSFQRPKKKVPWKGKSCIIAMPLTDREQAGLPPVMSPQEIRDRLQKWIDLGYPVHGFHVGDWNSTISGAGGASRPSFPDLDDMDLERKRSGPTVRIPNQGEWDAWVEYLNEEKLRALGVTPSTSEAPPSTNSPFSSTMSRVSSAYPSVTASPPVPSMSVASSHPRMSHSPFSPSMSVPTSSVYSALSQRGTPGLPNGSRPMHGYTQSIAIPGMGQRMNSPFEYPVSQMAVYGAGVRPPAEQPGGRRPFSPGHVQNMQSMGHLRSPLNANQQDFGRGFSPNPQIEQIRRQQEALARQQQHVQAQIARAQHQRQMTMFPIRAMSTEQPPMTPKIASPEREPPEIMHPTPRSHRHNLSAALEQGVAESVSTSSKVVSEVADAETIGPTVDRNKTEEIEEGEIVEEEAQEELPILHRPETIKDDDEKAEVETNPSVAGTPLLLDDKNPFANFKPLLPPEKPMKRPGFGHTAQPSLSKFNATAKEFSPSKATFALDPFNFDGNAFANHNNGSEKKASHAVKFSHKHNPSSLGLNVAAPVFTPAFAPKPALSEHPDNDMPGETSLRDNPLEVPSTESSFGVAAADNTNVSTPAKSVSDAVSSAFVFSGGKQQHVTPLKSDADPQSSAFSFRSVNFNVEAPEFKPQGLSVSSVDFAPEKATDSTNAPIFKDVVLDIPSKPTRTSKALPIVKPRSGDTSPVPAETEHEGEDGRPEAPADRNKRARHVEVDDQEITFADSELLRSLDNNVQQVGSLKESIDDMAEDKESKEILEQGEESLEAIPSEPAVDGVEHRQASEQAAPGTPLEEHQAQEAQPAVEEVVAPTDTTDGNLPVGPSDLVGNMTEIQEEGKLVTDNLHTNEALGQNINASKSPSVSEQREVAEGKEEAAAATTLEQNMSETVDTSDNLTVEKLEDGVQLLKTTAEPAPPTTTLELSAEAPVFKPAQPVVTDLKSGLSPFAQPFEFRPAVKEFTPASKSQTPEIHSHEEGTKPKAGGLMASKFASSPSPPPVLPELPAETSAVKDEVVRISNERAPAIEATEQTFDDKITAEERPESVVDHMDPASTLARFKEEDSRPESVLSRVGDLSYEEINAVMKQFEDDPDLGIIREDTPVKSTPLIDMRLPQNFRSDAPSPSPRRLDRAFNRGRERPFGGLGFDISGVHQLNYGSGEISDWNADLSPGQQDKLEARAHFFDDHVNDLVDNILESRLAPVERALQNIQESVQASLRPRASRRSMSTDNKESDADDEDEYDAYEGYAHYRSKSPQRRDRKSDKLKTAVMEAMSLAQSNLAPTKIDTTSVDNALQELQELVRASAKQPQQPLVDLSEVHQALSEIRSASQREMQVPVLDTSELSRYVEEMKALDQQRGPEQRANLLAIQTTLNDLQALTSEKPALPVIDLSSIHSVLAEIKQQADTKPAPPEVDLSEIQQALADLKAQASEKSASLAVDLSTVHEALAELRQQATEKPAPPEVDLSIIQSALAELKHQNELRSREEPSTLLRAMFEDVISTHPRLAPAQADSENEELKKLRMEMDDLKELLKNAEKRADGEAALRREAEEENDSLHRRLEDAQGQAAAYKEASEEAKKKLEVLSQEKEDHRGLSNHLRDLSLKNEALEKTLDEYRAYRERMCGELNAERNRYDSLDRKFQDVCRQHGEHYENRDSLREQLSQLQQRMSNVMQDVHHDEAEWRKREHDLISKNQLLQAALDHEMNRRARSELESERLSKEHRENLHYKSKHEIAQDEVSRLGAIVAGLQTDNKTHQEAALSAQRELSLLQERTEDIIASKVARLQDELDMSRSALQALQADSDARIARLQGQVDGAANELREQKARHDQNMEKMLQNHNRSIHEAEKRHAKELEQRLAFHEERLNDVKERYIRDMNHAADDKKLIQHRYEDKLEMSNDKIKHLENKVNDLQESLAVTKSAARAAVEAATAKGANLPTPASSVMASPPHRGSMSSASMPIARGSDVPEKISPQALRETIMVLQDQLQNREQRIDRLEAELAVIDKDAPAKVKERDTEIVMLRELLDVRVDDLQELIDILEKPEYDQAAAKDAAIRLKTQIKMEQQLKERAITGATLASSLPSSISSGLANLTQSPRAMVAAAAWGNWRKVRDSGIGAVSDFAINLGSQTPSRISSAPSTALNGVMTPPATKAKMTDEKSQSLTARPLAAAAAAAAKRTRPASPSSGARPLRAFNAQPRTLSGARPLARRGTNESRPGSSGSVIRASEPSNAKVEPPSTPILRKAESDFGDDVDEDASPLDGKNSGLDSDLEELAKSEQNAIRARSPRGSRSSTDSTRKAIVQVIEES